MSGVDQFALLIAAIGHDLGHFGKTNPFLVETCHEWAVTYNDASPLENMHCASLFRLRSQPGGDVFEQLDATAFKQARKVCISTILHTDAALHFNMVKQIKMLYETRKEVCDTQAGNRAGFNQDYFCTVLQENILLFEEAFLHLADVSNPLKPWHICQSWAGRVLDEFFAQGDEEKRLQIPVGMLNDRDKVNRPGSQHGFINFMVAPFVIEVVRILQPLDQLASQMTTNLAQWRNEWVIDASPDKEAIAKRDDDVKKIQISVDELLRRGGSPFSTLPMSI
jgi:hypothetical protein